MATRRYKINPGETEFQVTEEVGAATNSKMIELTVDLSTAIIGASGGTTRGIHKDEIIRALRMLENHLTKSNWPPA